MIPLVMSVIAKTETFQRNMAKARGTVGKFDASVKRSSMTMARMSKSLMTLAGVGGGLFLLQRGIRAVISASIEQERVERELSASLSSTGDATQSNIEDLKRYASELQQVTIYGDEQIISQIAYAKNLGVSTEQLKDATKAAIGLAARYRLDLKTSMMLVGRASLGQTQMLTRYGIVLEDSLSPQAKFNELLKIGAANFHLAEAETESFAGAWAQFANAAGDLAEAIGEPLLPTLTEVAKQMTAVAEEAQKIENVMNRLIGLATAYKNAMMWFYRESPTMWPMRQALGALASPITPAQAPEGTLEISPWAQGQIDEMNRFTEAHRVSLGGMTDEEAKAAAQRVQITSRMYADMGQFGDGYLQVQIALLDQQKQEYKDQKVDLVLLEEWYANEVKKINEKMRIANLNAFQLYQEELRRDMENWAEYTAEKAAEAAMSIEGSMSNAFQTLIQDGNDWRDAMKAFFQDVANAFAKMAADMAARAAMDAIIGGLTGMFAGALGGAAGGSAGGGFGGGAGSSMNMPGTTLHSGWVPAGVPSFRRGRGLGPNEMVAVIEKDELLAPKNQVVKSKRQGGIGGGDTIHNHYNINAIDTQSFQEALGKERSFLSDLSVVSRNSNHRSRRSR